MKEKFKTIKDNTEILLEFGTEFPKLSITLMTLILVLITGIFLRGGAWLNCYKSAWYEQNVKFENFDFKSITGACVVKRGDRWVPIERVVDAGDISDFE